MSVVPRCDRDAILTRKKFPVSSDRFPDEDCRTVSGNWKLETGNWKLETGNWKLETLIPGSEMEPPFPLEILHQHQ
jgi:hypothetical protein